MTAFVVCALLHYTCLQVGWGGRGLWCLGHGAPYQSSCGLFKVVHQSGLMACVAALGVESVAQLASRMIAAPSLSDIPCNVRMDKELLSPNSPVGA